MPEKEQKYKYKVGDRVRVKTLKDLKKTKGYPIIGEIAFLDGAMSKLCGKTVTIEAQTTFSQIKLGYRVKEDVGGFTWTNEMFEDIPEGDSEDWSVKQKPITSIEDVAVIFRADTKCSGCDKCPVRDYEFEGRKGDSCYEVKNLAADFLEEYVAGKKEPSPEVPKAPVTEANCKGNHSCVVCEYRKEIDKGFILCTKWHNLTCDDGYCHHFDPRIDFQI